MRLVVTKLLVRSFDLDHMDLFWEIAPIPARSPDLNTHEIYDYDFYVLRSGDSPLGEYSQIAGPLRDQYRLRDVQVSLLHKWRKYYYKLKVVHRASGEEFISKPVTFEAERDLIAVEITRQEDMLFREFIGRRCWLFPLRTFGPGCSCYDIVLGRVTRASHLPCYGTGYLGGFHQPIECFVQIDPIGKSRTESPLQEGQHQTTTGRLISFPPVSPGDILVESENKRWKVISMTPTERLRGVVRQEIVLHHIPFGDIEYELPMNLDASKIETSARRNFTNPQNLESDGDYADVISFFGQPQNSDWGSGAVCAPVGGGGGGGGVASVRALAPLSSSLGANPVISFPSWPANAPGALTNNGAGVLSWVPAGSGTVVDVPSIATEVLVAGEAVRFVTGGVQRADSNAPTQLEPVGFAVAGAAIGAPVLVRFVGAVDVAAALFDAAPTAADVGKRVWLSTTAGRVTLTPPSAVGDVVQRVGIFATLAGGVGGSPQILVQIGDPVLL